MNNDLIDRKALLLDLSQDREDGTFEFSEEQAEAADKIVRYVYSRIMAQPAVPCLARVLTLEEVKQAEGRDIWLELSGNIAEDVLTAATIEGCGTKGISTRYESLNYSQYCARPYGWRCWSARPTDEQRKAAPWSC